MKKFQWIAENSLLAIIIALILWFLLTLGGCYNYKKAAVQHGKAVSSYPQIGADYCARTYPVTGISKRDTVTQYDTLWGAGETFYDTLYMPGSIDTVRISEVRIVPKTVVKRFHITDTVRIIDLAALDVCNLEKASILRNLEKVTAEREKYQAKAKQRLWWVIGLAGLTVGYLFFRIRGAFVK